MKPGQRGACLQCVRRKRKCDHKQPKCSQCVRLGVQCESQTFKILTTSAINLAPSRRRRHKPTTAVATSQNVDDQPPQTGQISPTITELLLEPATHARQQSDIEREWDKPSADGMGVMFDSANEPSLIASIDQLWDPITVDGCGLEEFSTFPVPHLWDLPPENMTDILGSFEKQSVGQLSPDICLPVLSPRTTQRLGSSPLISHTLLPDATPANYTPAEPVPNLNSTVPWPSDMLHSPESRFLWHFFLSVTEDGLLCCDLEPMKSTGLQDPYIAVLPQLALSNANLRKAVLCFGASQYKALGRDDKYSSMVVKFSRESSFSFVREATSVMPDERDTLATIAAGVFLHYFSLDRRTPYLHLSTWLASKLLSRPTKSANIRQISNEEILNLLRWSVISSACSLGLSQTYLSLENFRMIQLLEEEVGLNLSGHSALFKDWINHPLYAFSSRLVNPLLLMGKLIQQTMLMGTGQGMPEEHAAQYQQEVLEVEEGLSHARREDLRLLNSLNPTDPDPLICVNESMHAAASILLHSRLKGLPSTAPVIRSNVDIIVNQLSDIAGDSRALFAVVFPLFTAGCEAVDSHARKMIELMLQSPKGLAFHRGDLVAALRHIWQIRDLEPGLPWPSWRDRVDHPYRIDRLI